MWTCSMEWECEHESELPVQLVSVRIEWNRVSEASTVECANTHIRRRGGIMKSHSNTKFQMNKSHTQQFWNIFIPETRMPFNLWTHSSAPHKLLCFNNIFKHQKPQIVSSLLSTQPVVWAGTVSVERLNSIKFILFIMESEHIWRCFWWVWGRGEDETEVNVVWGEMKRWKGCLSFACRRETELKSVCGEVRYGKG